MNIRTRSALLLILLLCLPAYLPAQATSASIFGSVQDPSGALIPQATVTVVHRDTNTMRTALTDASGQFTLTFLPVGNYTIEVEATGFKKFVQRGIVLDVGRQARVDAVLQVGAMADAITVTSDAPLVNTSDPSIGRTINNKEVESLPLVNRDLLALLNLTPGVRMNTDVNSQSVGSPEHDTTINGSGNAMGASSYYLDGGKNSSPIRNTGAPLPNPDAVQEFRVITNSFGAEFGHFSGGVIDVVTRSGSNEIHGSLFEYLRNNKLEAQTWNSTSAKAPLHRNQFGGSVGGPVIRNKTFFFFSYQGLRQRQSVIRNSAIPPTATERAGDFSASTRTKPIDPTTKLPYPSNIIPQALFDKTALQILSLIPSANRSDLKYETVVPRPQDTNEQVMRIDHSISTRHQLSGSYFHIVGTDTEPITGGGNIPWSNRVYSTPQHNLNATETWTVSPNITNQFRLSYSRYFTARAGDPAKSLGRLRVELLPARACLPAADQCRRLLQPDRCDHRAQDGRALLWTAR